MALLGCASIGLFVGCRQETTPPPLSTKVPAVSVAPSPTGGQTPVTAPAKPGPWQTFVAEDGSFSVSMPGVPQKLTKQANSALGPATMDSYALESGAVTYYVFVTDYQAGGMTPEKADAYLQQRLEGIRKVKFLTIKSEKKLTMNGSAGLDLIVNSQNNRQNPSQIHQQLFIVKNRIYVVSTEHSLKQDHDKDTDRFLISFKLLSSKSAP